MLTWLEICFCIHLTYFGKHSRQSLVKQLIRHASIAKIGKIISQAKKNRHDENSIQLDKGGNVDQLDDQV
jgi:hypothetical protein